MPTDPDLLAIFGGGPDSTKQLKRELEALKTRVLALEEYKEWLIKTQNLRPIKTA